MVAIIDYGAGNLSSVKKALDYLGAESEITQDKEKILSASHVILPGVGSFGDAMESMRERGLVDTVKQAAREKNFLGICLGLQLLFESSDESPGVEGLGILNGKIKTIPKDNGLKFRISGGTVFRSSKRTEFLKILMTKAIFILFIRFILTVLTRMLLQGLRSTACQLSVRFKRAGFVRCSFTLKKAVNQVLRF